jgi:hypothetical protein
MQLVIDFYFLSICILRVPWTEKRTNFSVLEDVKPKRSLEATILQLKLAILVTSREQKGHWNGTLCLDKLKDTGSWGKPRTRWFDSIKEATGVRLEDLREAVQDRKKWRTLVEEKTRNRVQTNVE